MGREDTDWLLIFTVGSAMFVVLFAVLMLA